MQNIVTWGQNMSANIEEFACFSMGGLFSGVPPCCNGSHLVSSPYLLLQIFPSVLLQLVPGFLPVSDTGLPK